MPAQPGPRTFDGSGGAGVEFEAAAGGDGAEAAVGSRHPPPGPLGAGGCGNSGSGGYNIWRGGDGSEFIRWCGLLLNIETMEVGFSRPCLLHTVTVIHLCVNVWNVKYNMYMQCLWSLFSASLSSSCSHSTSAPVHTPPPPLFTLHLRPCSHSTSAPVHTQIQADYTRYCGAHVATSLTVPLTNKPGECLQTRVQLAHCLCSAAFGRSPSG